MYQFSNEKFNHSHNLIVTMYSCFSISSSTSGRFNEQHHLSFYGLTHWGRDKWPPFSRRLFKCIFLKENVRILIKISLKFVPKSPIDNMPALFRIMAWRLPGDKPLSEAMMVSLLTHICVAQPRTYKHKQNKVIVILAYQIFYFSHNIWAHGYNTTQIEETRAMIYFVSHPL